MINAQDEFYPTVDFDFLCKLIEDTGKVIEVVEVGNTKAYVLGGPAISHNRTVLLRNSGDNTINLEWATSIAYKLKSLGVLLKWLEDNKKWKDGGYFQ